MVPETALQGNWKDNDLHSDVCNYYLGLIDLLAPMPFVDLLQLFKHMKSLEAFFNKCVTNAISPLSYYNTLRGSNGVDKIHLFFPAWGLICLEQLPRHRLLKLVNPLLSPGGSCNIVQPSETRLKNEISRILVCQQRVCEMLNSFTISNLDNHRVNFKFLRDIWYCNRSVIHDHWNSIRQDFCARGNDILRYSH